MAFLELEGLPVDEFDRLDSFGDSSPSTVHLILEGFINNWHFFRVEQIRISRILLFLSVVHSICLIGILLWILFHC